MGFTTQIFAFIFMPVFFLAYFLCEMFERIGSGSLVKKLRLKDWILIIFSIGFYVYSGLMGAVKILVTTVILYVFSLVIHKRNEKNKDSKLIFVVGVVALVLNLVYFKYTGFLSYNITGLFMDEPLVYNIAGPIGISFITFSAISYITDVYRKDSTPGSFTDCLLFMTFFPKIVSGPIVLWKNFQKQIKNRKSDVDDTINGINRIVVGFAKKVLLADVFGLVLSKMYLGEIDQLTAVFSFVLYMLQIYYDFSGYSDIAIGLSEIMGFKFDVNFNFPYRSKSISEFWRRWHISLGTWFRQYVYFPLGGNRKGKGRTLFNLGVVFALTGIWHGAGWNYILWGAINGFLVIIEHVIVKKDFYKKIPEWIKYTVTMLIVISFWQLFRFQDMSDVAAIFGTAFGTIKAATIPYTWRYFMDTRVVVFAIIGIIGATAFGSAKLQEVYKKFVSNKAGYAVQEVLVVLLLVVCLLFVTSSNYSPFIYFQY